MVLTKTAKNKLQQYAPCTMVKSPISCKLMYKMLTDISDKDGLISISQREIYRSLGISKSTVTRGTKRLRKSKHLYRIPQFDNNGKQLANLYKLR